LIPWQALVDEGMEVDAWIDVSMPQKDRVEMFMSAMVDSAWWAWAEINGR